MIDEFPEKNAMRQQKNVINWLFDNWNNNNINQKRPIDYLTIDQNNELGIVYE